MKRFFFIYLLIMNILCFLFMGMDKHKSIHRSYRIPEKVLFGLSFFGGSLGGCLGMICFHHKTKKTTFKIGFPLILCLHCIGIFFYITKR